MKNWNSNNQSQKPKLIRRISDASEVADDVARVAYIEINYQQNCAKKFDVIKNILKNGTFLREEMIIRGPSGKHRKEKTEKKIRKATKWNY